MRERETIVLPSYLRGMKGHQMLPCWVKIHPEGLKADDWVQKFRVSDQLSQYWLLKFSATRNLITLPFYQLVHIIVLLVTFFAFSCLTFIYNACQEPVLWLLPRT
jgi:hypothetical protein